MFKLTVQLLEKCHNNVIRNMGESKGISSDVKNTQHKNIQGTQAHKHTQHN